MSAAARRRAPKRAEPRGVIPRLDPEVCPTCGDEVKGALETVQARANLTRHEDGSYDFAHEPATVFWETQAPVTRKGHIVVLCPNGHEWTATTKEAARA